MGGHCVVHIPHRPSLFLPLASRLAWSHLGLLRLLRLLLPLSSVSPRRCSRTPFLLCYIAPPPSFTSTLGLSLEDFDFLRETRIPLLIHFRFTCSRFPHPRQELSHLDVSERASRASSIYIIDTFAREQRGHILHILDLPASCLGATHRHHNSLSPDRPAPSISLDAPSDIIAIEPLDGCMT